MQPKKRSSPRGIPSPMASDKGPRRRPEGMQTLGTLGYEQLRRALHLLGGAAER